MSVNFKSNKKAVLEEVKQKVKQALTECGMQAEAYTKMNITKVEAVDTGALRNSITYEVNEGEEVVYIGSNLDYAKYVEFGTGQYVAGGRPTPWKFQNSKGEWFMTRGIPKREYLKPAIADNAKEYRQIIENRMKS